MFLMYTSPRNSCLVHKKSCRIGSLLCTILQADFRERSCSIQVPANWTTYPTSRRRDRGTYWYREYRTRQQERRASCCSLWGAALLRGCKRISRKTYPFVRLADACVYLTHPQEQSRSQPLPHTVLSRKNIPYRPTNVCSLRQAPDAMTKAAYKRPANHEVSTLLGI